MAKDSLRLLILGSPGAGKTRFLRNLTLRWPHGGVVVDPTGDFAEDASENFPGTPLRYHSLWNPDVEVVASEYLSVDPPSLLILDEAHRFIRRGETVKSNPLLGVMDIARNYGMSWALGTKHAAALPPDITTLANVIMISPPRTPSVRRWLSEAGLDVEAGDLLPRGEWYWLSVGGETERIHELLAFERIERFLLNHRLLEAKI